MSFALPSPPRQPSGPAPALPPSEHARRGAALGLAYEDLLHEVWQLEDEWDRVGHLMGRRLISGEVYARRRGSAWSWEHR